jgi:diguanylate cyclase (GGDEF)-like protein
MTRTISGRITLNLIAGIVITVVTIVLAIAWMASRQDSQAEASTETMVAGGVAAMKRRAEALANDYGWWDDAYLAFQSGDSDWLDTNVGSSVTETMVADLFAIISPDGEIAYAWDLDEEGETARILTPEVIEAVRALTDGMPVESLAARGAFLRIGDEPMVIAVSRVVPFLSQPDIDPEVLPLFVAGLRLTEERLGELGNSFLIEDLHFEAGSLMPATRSRSALPVLDIFGDTIGHYIWTPPTPGDAVLRQVLPPIAVALVLFSIVAGVTAFRARRIAIALTESEKVAVVAARTDGMTGLRNRTGFNEILDSPAYQSACAAGELAIVYLDINGFKAVNDSIGHQGGDELVKALTTRVMTILPPNALFARIGGDEFAVALVGKSVRDHAIGVAGSIVQCLDKPFTVHGFEFHVTAAVGYAVASGTGLTPGEIVRRADIAMYQAKNEAERDPVGYHSTMETGALEKKQVEVALRRGLDLGEFRVHYQPVARTSDLSLVGVEALVRWTSKEFGTIAPSLFVRVAEDTGLIHEIGKVVIEQACEAAKLWPGVKMAINISPVQLRDPSFADDLLAIVQRHGLSPSQFELELTEGILVNNPTIAKRKLALLKSFGFVLSLDDFGTGFSSIGYLRQFPFDLLKVDRSFVRDLGLNTTANALVQSLVSLGDAMDLSVIAEGIENEDQLKLLRLVQCEFVQGFLISRPMPAEELTALLETMGPERRFRIGREPDRRATAATG